jgi:hypothetical protein
MKRFGALAIKPKFPTSCMKVLRFEDRWVRRDAAMMAWQGTFGLSETRFQNTDAKYRKWFAKQTESSPK